MSNEQEKQIIRLVHMANVIIQARMGKWAGFCMPNVWIWGKWEFYRVGITHESPRTGHISATIDPYYLCETAPIDCYPIIPTVMPQDDTELMGLLDDIYKPLLERLYDYFSDLYE